MFSSYQKHKFSYQRETFYVIEWSWKPGYQKLYEMFETSTRNTMYFIVFAGDQWLSSFSLPSNVGEIDSQFMEKNQKLFSSLERLGKNK